jgi:phosphatidate cytidylyltransferase
MPYYIFLLLLIYFLLGAFAIFLINKKMTVRHQKDNWLKFATYFVIVIVLFLSITFNFFPFVSVVIIFSGLFELVRLLIKRAKLAAVLGLLIFSVMFYVFYSFSLLDQNLLLYTVFIVFVFDAFSQLSGQYFGRTKLFPSISPHKTVEGLAGGFIMAGITSLLVRDLLNLNIQESLFWTLGIVVFAFAGDLFASFIKRKLEIKDFSGLIPGHGGFLDRFDSLLFSSLFVELMVNLGAL